jgi:hypothetical protein
MDPSKDLAAYGYGSVAWKERVESWKQKQERMHQTRNDGGGDDGDDADLPLYGPGTWLTSIISCCISHTRFLFRALVNLETRDHDTAKQ